MKAATVRSLFAQLRQGLFHCGSDYLPTDCRRFLLAPKFPKAEQIAFSLKVIEQLGYDFQQDGKTRQRHPFMTKFSTGDASPPASEKMT